MKMLAPLLCVLLSACGGYSGMRIERRAGGRVTLGHFVSPASYEAFVRGELARHSGALEEALGHYELARAGAEDDPLLLARIAELYEELDRPEQADRAIEEGLALDPASQAIWETKARIAKSRNQLERAIEAFAKAAELSEGDAEPVIELARVLRERGASERADAVLSDFIHLHPSSRAALDARLELTLASADAHAIGSSALELIHAGHADMRPIREALDTLLREGHPATAQRIAGLLPDGALDTARRLDIARAASNLGQLEALLARVTFDDERTVAAAGRALLALSLVERAEEVLSVLRDPSSVEARLAIAELRLARDRSGEAALLVAPLAEENADAADMLRRALERGGLSALAHEVERARNVAP